MPGTRVRPDDLLRAITPFGILQPSRRGGRAAEGAPLLREYGLIAHRGFESLPLRQTDPAVHRGRPVHAGNPLRGVDQSNHRVRGPAAVARRNARGSSGGCGLEMESRRAGPVRRRPSAERLPSLNSAVARRNARGSSGGCGLEMESRRAEPVRRRPSAERLPSLNSAVARRNARGSSGGCGLEMESRRAEPVRRRPSAERLPSLTPAAPPSSAAPRRRGPGIVRPAH